MQVTQFTLNNIAGFAQIAVPLATTASHGSNVTVFVGNNGSGKTTLLKALATALSWPVAQIRSESGRGSPIPELMIANNQHSAAIAVEVLDRSKQAQGKEQAQEQGQLPDADTVVNWTVARSRKGRKGEYKSDLLGAAKLADVYRERLTHDEAASLPLMAFYSVERVVLDIPLKIKDKHSFQQLDGYDNSLSQGVDFRRFFEWFREREDSENESALSDEMLEQLRDVLPGDNETWTKLKQIKASGRDRQLTAVRSAIYQFMPGFSRLKVKRKPRLHMSIDKDGATFNVAQLSQGEKSLMALIGDIARRLLVELEKQLQGLKKLLRF